MEGTPQESEFNPFDADPSAAVNPLDYHETGHAMADDYQTAKANYSAAKVRSAEEDFEDGPLNPKSSVSKDLDKAKSNFKKATERLIHGAYDDF